MSLQWPKTIRGWVELVLAVCGLIGVLGGAGWQYHTSNAYASDVEAVLEEVREVEEYAAQGIKSATCNQLRATIRQLRREKEKYPDDWSASDESYLQDLLLQWQQYCVNNNG